MTEEQVVRTIVDHLTTCFPKACSCCKKSYTSLTQWISETTHVGTPVSYDAERDDWQPETPLGTITMVNCECGSTLSIGTEGLAKVTLWSLMLWAKQQTAKRGITVRALLADLRGKVEVYALANDS